MIVLTELNNIVNEMGIYRIALIMKSVLNITLTIVPLIVIILSMVDISKIVFNPNSMKENFKKPVNRIIAGLIVFLIPTIIDTSFSLIESYDNSTILTYYNNASIEKINSLKKEYDIQKKAEVAKEEAIRKEGFEKLAAEERKKNEQLEKIRTEYEELYGSSDSYSGDSVSSGTFGSVKVENGVFYIPNKRATSDSDIPKQSGQYGLNPIFWERLSALINDGKSKGYNITVTSGWRSYSSQRSLWDNSNRSCSERSRWVACPGGSRHGFGIAADLSFNGTGCSGGWDCNEAAAWVHANAEKYGLKFRMSWEPWHIEPSQVSGGNFGSCTATC
jgi:D-alanyl-D-alanine carboxypeptidase